MGSRTSIQDQLGVAENVWDHFAVAKRKGLGTAALRILELELNEMKLISERNVLSAFLASDLVPHPANGSEMWQTTDVREGEKDCLTRRRTLLPLEQNQKRQQPCP